MVIGDFIAIWPLFDPGWPLHDLCPQQCIMLWSGVLPIIFGSHRAFLSNLTSGWPQLTQCITLWSEVLPFKFGSRKAFLSNLPCGWPRMTPAWPLTPAMHYTLVRGSPKFSGRRTFLREIDLWMTFDLWWCRFEKLTIPLGHMAPTFLTSFGSMSRSTVECIRGHTLT